MFFMLLLVSKGKVGLKILIFPENGQSRLENLSPQDFCSASLLIQVSFTVGSWLCLLQFSTGQHRRFWYSAGGISLASLPLSKLPFKLSDLPVTQKDEIISHHEYLLSFPVLLSCFQSCCFPAPLSKAVWCVFPKQGLPGLLCRLDVSVGDLTLRFQCHLQYETTYYKWMINLSGFLADSRQNCLPSFKSWITLVWPPP